MTCSGRFRIAALVVLAALARHAIAQAEPPSASDLLQRAEDFFQRGVDRFERDGEVARALFEHATIHYDALVERHGIRNAPLLVNLGNAAMLAGDTGRAVLAYKRAEVLRPMDALVRRSLAHARARVGVELKPSVESRVRDLLLAWRGIVPRRAMLWTSLSAYVALWVLAILRLHGLAPWSRRMLLPAIVLCTLPMALLFHEQRSIEKARDAVLMRDAPALNGPSEGVYEPTFDRDLPAGVEVRLIESRHGWARVELIDGRETWVPLSAIARV